VILGAQKAVGYNPFSYSAMHATVCQGVCRVSDASIFARPKMVSELKDCSFYHTMDIPGYGLVQGEWDLRGRVREYLGGCELSGKRVLEVGPASGFLTFSMEKLGADVVGYDLSPEHDHDFVPFPDVDHDRLVDEHRRAIERLNNAFWLAHRAFHSKAKLVHGTVYQVPVGIGSFDLATFGAILLHLRDPFQALHNVLSHVRETVIITDRSPHRDVSIPFLGKANRPSIHFMPDAGKDGCEIGLWWRFSPEAIKAFIGVLGFGKAAVKYHRQLFHGRMRRMYTVVGHRTKGL
jgi:SAM-dependent methyltransferase